MSHCLDLEREAAAASGNPGEFFCIYWEGMCAYLVLVMCQPHLPALHPCASQSPGASACGPAPAAAQPCRPPSRAALHDPLKALPPHRQTWLPAQQVWDLRIKHHQTSMAKQANPLCLASQVDSTAYRSELSASPSVLAATPGGPWEGQSALEHAIMSLMAQEVMQKFFRPRLLESQRDRINTRAAFVHSDASGAQARGHFHSFDAKYSVRIPVYLHVGEILGQLLLLSL